MTVAGDISSLLSRLGSGPVFVHSDPFRAASLVPKTRAREGLIDAHLGSGLIKQRIARSAQGRSRGFRTIIAWRSRERSIFVYGFAKSRRDNIGETDLAQLKDLAALLLGYDDKELRAAVSAGELLEVTC